MIGKSRRGQQQLTISATVLFGVFNPDRLETLLDGVGRLIDGDDALAGRDHRQGDALEIFNAHWTTP
jgi:hypothetical protein